MTELENQSKVYKELRRQQVLKSDENVQSVPNVIENEYLNPFGLMEECEKRKLFQLSSSVPLLDKRANFRKKGSCHVKNYFIWLILGVLVFTEFEKFLSSTVKTSLNKYILIFQLRDMFNFWFNFNYSKPMHAFKHYAYKKRVYCYWRRLSDEK